ncbi:MAG: hypothetical protein A2Y57_02245 [Candidatus Woykebacteria bacterium RBG_13_40_7b]|uniref:GIY-YIG domain-containing protein n=1 Tax=Candidatus Woykebacteria bacterium RBG_13_40_7b TaxID=1802594 RepID=A0A1G1W905_9BACT|nr:MAG: hypothetical protein A2Y57_02245 [Candidatus Woykebacteria bacterium RBG_13_40_7b]
MAYCYVLKCGSGPYYVGSTRNVTKRLNDHDCGRVKFTKNKRPVTLIFVKEFKSYKLALDFEKRVKSWKKRKSIEKMLSKPDNIYKQYCGVV